MLGAARALRQVYSEYVQLLGRGGEIFDSSKLISQSALASVPTTKHTGCRPATHRGLLRAELFSKIITEKQIKVCTWLREFCSCSCLTVLPGPSWLLLSKTCKSLFTPLYRLATKDSARGCIVCATLGLLLRRRLVELLACIRIVFFLRFN